MISMMRHWALIDAQDKTPTISLGIRNRCWTHFINNWYIEIAAVERYGSFEKVTFFEEVVTMEK